MDQASECGSSELFDDDDEILEELLDEVEEPSDSGLENELAFEADSATPPLGWGCSLDEEQEEAQAIPHLVVEDYYAL